MTKRRLLMLTVAALTATTTAALLRATGARGYELGRLSGQIEGFHMAMTGKALTSVSSGNTPR